MQAVQDTQRHLKNEYISKSARPWTVPATDDASDDDDRQDSASESHSSVQRRDRMMQSANLLASKQAELKHLLKEKGRHDDMLRSELEVGIRQLPPVALCWAAACRNDFTMLNFVCRMPCSPPEVETFSFRRAPMPVLPKSMAFRQA